MAQARGALAGFEHELDAGLFFDVSLCLNELVTNAVRAMEPDDVQAVELEVSLAGDTLLAIIKDQGAGVRRLETILGAGEEGDFGLYIISRLAHRWGVDRVENLIWLEFEAAGQPLTRASAFTPEHAGQIA